MSSYTSPRPCVQYPLQHIHLEVELHAIKYAHLQLCPITNSSSIVLLITFSPTLHDCSHFHMSLTISGIILSLCFVSDISLLFHMHFPDDQCASINSPTLNSKCTLLVQFCDTEAVPCK